MATSTIVWADSAYAGKLVEWAKHHLSLTIKPVSRPKDASGFVVLPRRWVVERSLAWMMHVRRHARDYERLIQHSETLITWAAITLMTRRLARKGATPSWPRKPAEHFTDADRRPASEASSVLPAGPRPGYVPPGVGH